VGLEGGLLASLPPAALGRLLREEPALAERLLRWDSVALRPVAPPGQRHRRSGA
jgi:hypothetical protein